MENAPMQALNFTKLSEETMLKRAAAHFVESKQRRSIRHFSDEAIPLEVVRLCIAAAALAPSGAHKQPWTFVLVTDPAIKRRIRRAAELEEHAFYNGRASEQWLTDLEPFETDAQKPFLEDAPALVVLFAQNKGPNEEKHYYVKESVGIACGMFLSALNHCGLAALTHTPSPMKFLADILERPSNERAFLLIPVGYPIEDCQVPELDRRPLAETLIEF